MRYAKEYYDIFNNPSKASRILLLNKDKRRLVMSAMANLSRYLGIYGYWKDIVENVGLKYERRSGLETIIDIIDSNLDDVKTWLINVIQRLPRPHGVVLAFNALTGLRPSEGCISCKLLSDLSEKGNIAYYLDKELMMLQHFKYKDLFLRGNKNAYISFVTEDLLKKILETKPRATYSQIKSALRKRGFNCQMKNLRKLHATKLRKYLNKEVIDLLQGRISQDIFVRHYYKPTLMKVRDKALKGIKSLQNELLETLQ